MHIMQLIKKLNELKKEGVNESLTKKEIEGILFYLNEYIKNEIEERR